MGPRTRFTPVLVAGVLLAVPARALADAIHVVARGETLAAISERYYGSAAHEAVIVAANFLHLSATPALLPGSHLTIPSVSYHRVAPGETWERLAQRLLADGRRGPHLARANDANFNRSPSPGTVIRVPYLLRYVVTSDEPLFEVARRYYGDRTLVQFIVEFNHLPSQRLQRAQTLVLPIADVILRNTPSCAEDAALVEAHAAQRRVERELPTLQQYLHRGLYVEAVNLGARLSAARDLSSAQRVAVDRGLAEAYAALERPDLAAEALRDALAVDPGLTLDAHVAPPKLLEALAMARGGDAARTLAPAPPTARPDNAH